MNKRAHGFTIVELLIVIVVIAILAAISIVAYSGVQGRARLSVVQQELSTIGKQASLYAANQGVYPTTNAAWQQVLRDAGLSGKLGLPKDFIICANSQTFTVVAAPPAVTIVEQTGGVLYVARPSGITTATWDASTAVGAYTVERTCSQPGVITPVRTYFTWASQTAP